MKRKHQHRGFTLVELLVAAGLAMLIMAVLSTAFSMGMSTISQLKATGDLADRLRTVEVLLRSDLDAEHFESDGGRLNVSDLKIKSTSQVPTGGYFNIPAGGASTREGFDSDFFVSSRAVNHSISMTVKRTGQGHSEYFGSAGAALSATSSSDALGGGQNFATQWAEVRWFLGNPQTVGGMTTYTLYRGVRLLGNTNADVSTIANANDFLSTFGGKLNTPKDVASTLPTNKRAAINALTGANMGNDIVLTNVLSFEVKPYYTQGTSVYYNGGIANPTVTAPTADPRSIYNDYPFSEPTVAYDSGTPVITGAATGGVRLLAVMIKVRVFDPKNKLTRQMSLIVKL